MKRSLLQPMPVYFHRYISKCDDVELLEALRQSITELDIVPLEKWRALGDMVYAPGKWTIKDILQHLIDTERIFMYRALCFARNEKQYPLPYDENEYAAHAEGNRRTLEDLISELRNVHLSFLEMYRSFTPDMLAREGKSFKGEYSVAAIGFTMAGHQRWHFEVIRERYLPLVGKKQEMENWR